MMFTHQVPYVRGKEMDFLHSTKCNQQTKVIPHCNYNFYTILTLTIIIIILIKQTNKKTHPVMFLCFSRNINATEVAADLKINIYKNL